MPPPAPAVLAVASYFKGNPFLERIRADGGRLTLLTVERLLGEPWPPAVRDDLFAVPDFADRRKLVHAVAYLMRTRHFDRIVALDDFDVEVVAYLREHFQVPGAGESTGRLFRDKLAMRVKARDLGLRIPAFAPLVNHDALRDFLADVPGPWLVKPRGEASAAGIRVCATADDVWRRVDELGDEQSFHLVEKMVPGDLFHVDSLVDRGRVLFAEVNAYWKPLLDVYHGGGVYASRTAPRDSPDVVKLRAANEAVLAGFGLGHGASHTEFMKAHADGEFYFIETSCRVGGAETATMVEAATGVNLWAEWAAIELAQVTGRPYELPPVRSGYAGVVISLANCERPDTTGFADAEIVHRVDVPHHIGFVVAADSPGRVEELQAGYMARIRRDFHAAMPAADSVAT